MPAKNPFYFFSGICLELSGTARKKEPEGQLAIFHNNFVYGNEWNNSCEAS